MKRLMVVFLIFSFWNISAGENSYDENLDNKILVQWKNSQESFYFWIDKEIDQGCHIINTATSFNAGEQKKLKDVQLVQLIPTYTVFSPSKIIDCSEIKGITWDKQTLKNSFEFLKDPLKVAEVLSLDQLQKAKECIDYLSSDESIAQKVQKKIIDGVSASTLSLRHKQLLIKFALILEDKVTTTFDNKNRNYPNDKNEYHMAEDDLVLNVSCLKRKEPPIQLWFDGSYHSILMQKPLPKLKKMKCTFKSDNVIHFDGSGLRGNEEIEFRFSKNLPDEIKKDIVEEVEKSNNIVSARLYRGFLNYNPLNLLFYASKKIINKMNPYPGELLIGCLISGVILGGVIGYGFYSTDLKEKTVETVELFNKFVYETKDELLKKEVLVSGLESAIAGPIRNEFKKYIFLPAWKEISSVLKSKDFAANVIELLKENHFDQLIPIDLTINTIVIKPRINPLDLFSQVGFASLVGVVTTVGLTVGSALCLGTLGDQYVHLEKNKVEFK